VSDALAEDSFDVGSDARHSDLRDSRPGKDDDSVLVDEIESAVRVAKGSNENCSCSEVADHIFEMIDSQMPEEQVARLRAHAKGCPTCSKLAEAEVHVREIVKRSCCESAPSSLRVRITSQLEVYRSATQ